MHWFAGDRLGRGTNAGVDLAATSGTVIVPGSANVKGSYTQMVASTPWDVGAIQLHFGDCYWQTYLFDIGVGPAASEIVVLPNLFHRGWGTSGDNWRISGPVVPLYIPKGKRIAIRCQSTGGPGTPMNCHMTLFSSNWFGGAARSSVLTYGMSTVGSTLSDIHTPTGSTNIKSSYRQLVAATPRDVSGLLIAQNFYNVIRALVDIAVGANGSEVDVIPNLVTGNGLAGSTRGLFLGGYYPCPIPKGSRISYRYQFSSLGGSPQAAVAVHLF